MTKKFTDKERYIAKIAFKAGISAQIVAHIDGGKAPTYEQWIEFSSRGKSLEEMIANEELDLRE